VAATDTARWIRSSFEHGKGGVEIAQIAGGYIAMRHGSPDPDHGPALLFSRDEWDAFLAGVNAGEYEDLGRPT
jgi:hypothetical protein